MTQIEILNLAYFAKYQDWSDSKEYYKAHPSTITKNKVEKEWAKLMEIKEMIVREERKF